MERTRNPSNRNSRTGWRWTLLAIIVFIAGGWTRGGCEPDYEASEAREREDVEALASSTYLGRGTPSPELDLAAAYIADKVDAAGFEPIFDDYLQTYAMNIYDPMTTEFEVSIDGVTLSPDEYGIVSQQVNPSETPLTLPVVYAGYGLVDPVRGVDDFADIDVAGKAVIVLKGAPWPVDPTIIVGFDKATGKDMALAHRDAKVMIYVSEELEPDFAGMPSLETLVYQSYRMQPIAYLPNVDNQEAPIIPILGIPPSVFDARYAPSIGATFLELKSELDQGIRRPAETGTTMEITVTPVAELEAAASNVIAQKRGTHSSLADEWILLMAHYDHAGYYPDEDGNIVYFPGANDNASGTAAVLEIARLISDIPTHRSVLLVFTSGEELGFLGSTHFSKNAPIPLDKIVATINLDMVGNTVDSELEVLTSDSRLLYELFDLTAWQHELTVLPDQSPEQLRLYRTDSRTFERLGIPAVSLITADDPNYNTVNDVPANINYEGLSRITLLTAEVSMLLALPSF